MWYKVKVREKLKVLVGEKTKIIYVYYFYLIS